ncbi:MAG TPA: carbon-nitrogen hydrolase family protein [bacterium]|nr:carbon-nitrogen hydrolase family protein [bacterium]
MIPAGYSKYEKVVTVGCVNFRTVWGEKTTNSKRIMELTKQAASLGCNLVVFPELALTGFECPGECGMHRSEAETIPGSFTESLAELARSLDIYVVVGMPERDRSSPESIFISNVIVGPEGVLGAYRKLSFADRSAACFRAGDRLPVFETRYGPVGIQTCSNMWMFPELSRILALKGARLILTPTASPSGPGKPFFLVQQTGARATENGVFTASANLVGKEVNLSYYGHSTIAGPAHPRMAHIFAEAGEEEEIISATLNFEQLHAFRESLRFPYGLPIQIVLRELEAINRNWTESDRIYPETPLYELFE